MLRSLRFLLVLPVVIGAAAAVEAARDEPEPRPWVGTWTATAQVAEVAVYPDPGAAEPTARLQNPTKTGAALVFLVDGTDVRGEWLPVHLPLRPNGSTGWVRAADVRLTRNDHRLRVDLRARQLVFEERGEVRWRTPIGVGAEAMPTPPGRYYVKELVLPPRGEELYGPFALGLSGFTEAPKATDFAGGEGVLAIHGTDDPDSIGRRVSHGCIRVPNDVITYLAAHVPMGTPVDVE
ncbi:MAG TPA: L,D-transpeptidase [Acidimicrobiales bacterium]